MAVNVPLTHVIFKKIMTIIIKYHWPQNWFLVIHQDQISCDLIQTFENLMSRLPLTANYNFPTVVVVNPYLR